MKFNGVPPRKLRLGMIGGGKAGFIGAVHRNSALLDGHWELVSGALSRNPDTAGASARAYGIAPDRSYSNFAEMIECEKERRDRPDAMTICTTNETHFEVAKACLEAGFNVMCEKPLAAWPKQAWDLVDLVESSGRLFAVAHCYTGYPLVRLARDMVRRGELGEIRSVVVEYASQYGAEKHYTMPWLDDPSRSGPSGVVAGTGTHAHHLAEFVSGLEVEEISADLTCLVPGHILEDHATVHLRFAGGARGVLWNTSVAIGNENNLSIRVFGSLGSLKWRQESPNVIEYSPLKKATRLLTRAGFEAGEDGEDWTRTPTGAPEGYHEAFANLYVEFGQAILEKEAGRYVRESYLFPTVKNGARGINFVHAALLSSKNNAAFTALAQMSTKAGPA